MYSLSLIIFLYHYTNLYNWSVVLLFPFKTIQPELLTSMLYLNFFTVSNQWYYLVLRLVNMVGDDIVVMPSDGDPKGGFVIRKNLIAVITKKVRSPLQVRFTAYLKADGIKKFYINYKPIVELKPITTKNAPVTLTVTRNGESNSWWLY